MHSPHSPSGQRVVRLRRLARLWDDALRMPGTNLRVGLDAIVGIVPAIGDAIGAMVASVIVLGAVREGAPPAIVVRMLLNLGADAVIGAVPVAGDLFDARFHANVRNVALLDGWLARPGAVRRASRVLLVSSAMVVLGVLGAVVWLSVWLARAVLRLIGV